MIIFVVEIDRVDIAAACDHGVLQRFEVVIQRIPGPGDRAVHQLTDILKIMGAAGADREQDAGAAAAELRQPLRQVHFLGFFVYAAGNDLSIVQNERAVRFDVHRPDDHRRVTGALQIIDRRFAAERKRAACINTRFNRHEFFLQECFNSVS